MLTRTVDDRCSFASFGLALGCLLFMEPLRCEAQGNLVPNPSFEAIDACPCVVGFEPGGKPLHWEKWSQSPDYFHACIDQACSFDTILDVPLNGFGFQYAHSGEAYVGMYAYEGNSDYREYVGCELLEPLVLGQTYLVSFYTNVAFGGTYSSPTWACNNMGMLFTMDPSIWIGSEQPSFALRNYAHLLSEEVTSDTAAWSLVGGTFTADSAYRYLVLGNFFSDELTDTTHVVPGPSLGAYYFVDDVCVSRGGGQSCAPVGVREQDATRFSVFPNPAFDWLEVSPQLEPGVKWEVLDLAGRSISQGETSHDSRQIELEGCAPGELFLCIHGRSRQYVRFVVIR